MNIRFAVEADVPVILHLIKHLAEFEKMLDRVTATEEDLQRTLFGPRPYAEVILAEQGDSVAGFALFFHNYSTFFGSPGIYLEDLCVVEDFRGQGIGEALLQKLASLCIERNCTHLEWNVLDWNEGAIRFYERIGAKLQRDWIPVRITGDQLQELANQS